MCAFINNLLITGPTDKKHLGNLDAVLSKLQDAGVRLELEKCAFMLPEIEYLGHRISSKGLHSTQEKVTALKGAPTPTSVSQLKSFLGLLNYYGKFLLNLLTALASFYKLL